MTNRGLAVAEHERMEEEAPHGVDREQCEEQEPGGGDVRGKRAEHEVEVVLEHDKEFGHYDGRYYPGLLAKLFAGAVCGIFWK